MDTHNELKTSDIDAQIVMMVHDSVVAIVKDEHVDAFNAMLTRNIQKDRGVGIPDAPVGVDFDVSQDYSIDKFTKQYGELLEAA